MQDLTTGSLSGHLLKTTSFMLVSMIFQTLYVLVDLFWVGRLGTDAVAAVGISANLSFLVLAISQMLGVGTTTMVSHAAGSKQHDQAIFLFNQSQVLSMVAGVTFLAVAMFYRTAYAASLSADASMQAQTEQYLLWFIPAMALQFAMVAMGAALRGTGNFKPGMYRADRHRHHQHRAGAGADLRVGSVRPARASAARRWRRLSRSRSAWCGSRSTSSTRTRTCGFTSPTGNRSSACGGGC